MAEESVPTWEKLGMTKEAFDRLPPSNRLGLERTHNPKPVPSRRPWQTYTPTPEEQQALDEIKAREGRDAHTTRWRQMRDAAQAKAEP
jgi:hypothetical protein